MKYLILAGILLLVVFSASGQIETDDFRISNEMLKNANKDKCIDSVYSFDQAWFRNTNGNRFLMFELHTDYYRYKIYLCDTGFVLPNFIDQIRLDIKTEKSGFNEADRNKKIKTIGKFYESSNIIDEKYFISNKGIYIGIEKSQAIEIYGEPNSKETISNIEIFEWNYEGSIGNEKIDNQLRSNYAKDSFGYNVKMYFKKGKLIAMIITNEIP